MACTSVVCVPSSFCGPFAFWSRFRVFVCSYGVPVRMNAAQRASLRHTARQPGLPSPKKASRQSQRSGGENYFKRVRNQQSRRGIRINGSDSVLRRRCMLQSPQGVQKSAFLSDSGPASEYSRDRDMRQQANQAPEWKGVGRMLARGVRSQRRGTRRSAPREARIQ